MFGKAISLKTKLIAVISLFTMMVVCAISAMDYYQLKQSIIEEESVQYELIQDQIVGAVKNIDRVYRVFEEDMDLQMKKALEEMAAKYKSEPDLGQWDYAALKNRYNGMDIYVIDRSIKIAYSNLEKEIGLDFSDAGSFTALLKERLDGKSFTADGMEVSVNTGEIRKYAYLPTPDNQYLLEVGISLQDSSLFNTFNFLDVSKDILQKYDLVRDITVYTHDGYALGKQGADGKASQPAEQMRALFDESFKNQEIREKTVMVDGKELLYRYAPYRLDEQSNDLSRSRVIEIVYDNTMLHALLASKLNESVIKVLVAVVLAVLVAILISRLLTRPLERMKQLVERTAQFDLRDELSYDVRTKDEIGQMAQSILEMRSHLRGVVQQLLRASGSLAENAQSIRSSTAEVSGQSKGTAEAAELSLRQVQETMATTEEMNATLNDIQTVIHSVAEQTTEAAATSVEVSRRADGLKHSSTEAQDTAAHIYMEVKEEVETAISQSSSSMEQIHQTVDAILNIAKQTNMLALNAAIEASRAGESGRGFSVVAEEIRRLATHSSELVGNIQAVIQVVRESVDHLSSSSTKVLDFIDQKVRADYATLIDISSQYDGDAKYFGSLLSEFSAAFEQLSASITSTVDAVEHITESVAMNTEQIETISEQSSRIAGSNDEIAAISQKNSEYASLLREIVERFKV
ncbi:methyl-accepting chemotaxis protein [Paenibacillus sp. SYP-B4298]|uniref:methyl-accepting chemotaxis protein n=1 Tax=Paenibacillus sp. SYP-B4298 TaxID=2996034 RepID=UPI0022DE56C3|nr:methyl-accepting chemotaxis protein [Paenibacillus sp. SYP-B4298]